MRTEAEKDHRDIRKALESLKWVDFSNVEYQSRVACSNLECSDTHSHDSGAPIPPLNQGGIVMSSRSSKGGSSSRRRRPLSQASDNSDSDDQSVRSISSLSSQSSSRAGTSTDGSAELLTADASLLPNQMLHAPVRVARVYYRNFIDPHLIQERIIAANDNFLSMV